MHQSSDRRTIVKGTVELLEGRRLLTAVTGFSLYNADTNEMIRPLVSGDVIDYAALGTRNITIVADTDAETARVKFALDGNGNQHTETEAPFGVAGNVGSKLNVWNASLGQHTLVARAATAADDTFGGGAAILFGVIDSSLVAPEAGDDVEVEDPAPAEGGGGADSGGNSDNDAPTVSLGATALGTFAGPAYSLLRASASDPDGSISKVEWYANGQLIGQATSAPYMSAWREVPPGTYEVTAKAYDNDGGTKTSAPGTIKIVEVTGKTFHVATDGSDSGKGTESKPFKSIRRAQSSAEPGDTILIHPGTYKEEIRLSKSGTSAKPITFKAADGPGTVTIDADGREYLAVPDYAGAGKWTTFIGISFKNAKNEPGGTTAAVKTADGWRLIDVHVENVEGAAVGMFGKNVVLVRVSAEENGCTGISGSQLSNAMLLDSVSHHNNTDGYSGGFEGGGGKFTKTDGLLVDGHHAYENNGPGIWFDIGNANVAIRNGRFHDNNNLYRDDGSEKIGGRGVFFEMGGIIADGSKAKTRGPMLVEHNTFWDNEHAGVDVYATSHAVVRDNTFINDYINLKDKRPDPFIIKDLTIVENRFKNGHVFADSATVKDYKNEDFVINRNTYDNDGEMIFSWDGKKFSSLSAVSKALGFEKNGTFGDIAA